MTFAEGLEFSVNDSLAQAFPPVSWCLILPILPALLALMAKWQTHSRVLSITFIYFSTNKA